MPILRQALEIYCVLLPLAISEKAQDERYNIFPSRDLIYKPPPRPLS